MLTVVDRPILQHVVDEARAAGVEHFIFVTGRNKAVIEDHFDIAYELEDTLRKRGKTAEYEDAARRSARAGQCSFTRQQAPLGLGHAIWCARELVGDEPFAVLLPDMVTLPGDAKTACLAQCVETYDKHGGNVIAVEEVAPEETHQYGVVAIGQDFGRDFEITGMVEKPPKGTAPVQSHHLRPLHPAARDFRLLEKVEKGAGGEIQLTDGMKALAASATLPRRALRRPHLRLRLEDRLSHRQSRLRAGRSGDRRPVPGGTEKARRALTARAPSTRWQGTQPDAVGPDDRSNMGGAA